MNYQKTITLNLGAPNSGLNLEAQPINQDGENFGDPISTGFVEIFPGNYLWTGELDENMRGAVKFRDVDSGQYFGIVAVEPVRVSGYGPFVVSVTIRSLSTGLPLTNAFVRFYNDTEDASATTDNTGKATVTIKSGTFNIAVAASGFVTVTDTVDIPGDTTLPDINLGIQSLPVVETEGMTIVTCLASDFGKPQKNVKFSLIFEDKTHQFVNGVFQPDKEQTKLTDSNGRAELQVWPSYILQDNDFEPITYVVSVDGNYVGRIIVPPGGGNLADLLIAEEE
jgi:hypothetical protein